MSKFANNTNKEVDRAFEKFKNPPHKGMWSRCRHCKAERSWNTTAYCMPHLLQCQPYLRWCEEQGEIPGGGASAGKRRKLDASSFDAPGHETTVTDSPRNLAKTIDDEIDSRRTVIRKINDQIHANPEPAYQEFKAHDAFIAILSDFEDLKITPHAYGVGTAFSADYGSGGRLIIFNAEYDALPGVGHACGHNLISSSSLAAFLGVVAALKKFGAAGRVRLLGTPAKEGGGGKLKLIEAGAYKDCSACLMIHPGPGYRLSGLIRGVSFVPMLASIKKRVYFTGREAHAATAPWEGVNALDAVCLSYNAVSMLRQQIRPYEHLHGVFREVGDRPNAIPAHCCIEYYIRSDTKAHAEVLWQRVLKCFQGAAIATECQIEVETLNFYADVRASKKLCQAYVEAMPAGTVHPTEPSDFLAGSTDMGDVCYVCPGFHGAFGINTPRGQGTHTKGFAEAAGTGESLGRALECGKGMASVGWRVLSDDAFADETMSEWREDMRKASEGK